MLVRTSGRVASRDALAKLGLLLASYLPRSGSRFLLFFIGSGESDSTVLQFYFVMRQAGIGGRGSTAGGALERPRERAAAFFVEIPIIFEEVV